MKKITVLITLTIVALSFATAFADVEDTMTASEKLRHEPTVNTMTSAEQLRHEPASNEYTFPAKINNEDINSQTDSEALRLASTTNYGADNVLVSNVFPAKVNNEDINAMTASEKLRHQ